MEHARKCAGIFLLLLCVCMQLAGAKAQITTKVSASGDHSFFLRSDGSLWAMGGNGNGQLGDGTFNQQNRPELIVASNVTVVVTGATRTQFIKNDGSLWGTGYNNSGQLGDGTYTQTNRPEQVVSNGVTAIAAGNSHTLFLKSDGSLWAMGYNAYGQLGDGTYTQTNLPEQILSSNVTAIAAGANHSLFLKGDGSLWAMGYNNYGQLGDGTANQMTNRPEMIVSNGVTAVAAGDQSSFFLKSDGSLWAMGYNAYGGLGDGSYNQTNRPEQIVSNGVAAVAASLGHTLFLKVDSSLWGMGRNQYGELGDGTYTQTNRPEQVVSNGVTAIAAGNLHSIFLKMDGSLWGMGYNTNGELGDGTIIDTNRPEQITPMFPVITSQPASQTNYFGATAIFSVASPSIAPIGFQWQRNGSNLLDGGRISGSATSNLDIINLADSDSGTYSVTLSNSVGVLASSNAVLTVGDLPNITAQPTNQTIGAGSNVTFTATAYGAPPLVFQWYYKGAPIGSPNTGSNNTYLSLTNVQTNQSGTYLVEVFNATGSQKSVGALLTVVVFAPTISSQPSNQTILLGRSASFTVSVNGTPPYQYQWLFNGSSISNATNPIYTIPSLAAANTGNYSVTVSNSSGSTTSSNALLTVVVPPSLNVQFLAGYPLISMNGMLNSNFNVQYSSNLPATNWINLLSISNLSSSPYQFLDPAGNRQPSRFYRAFMH